MQSVEIIRQLSNANGAPAHEGDVLRAAKSLLKDDFHYLEDRMGNCLIKAKTFDEKKLHVLIDGHMDEVSLMVQAITDKGLLKVINLGGWDIKNLIASKVRLILPDGRLLKGVVVSKPVHFLTVQERKTLPEIHEISVDIGAVTRQEVIDLGVQIGMPLIPDVDFEYDEARDIMIGKAFDDRLGCSLVVSCLNDSANHGHNQVLGVLSTQEESGLRGARSLAARVNPEFAIVFEGSPADDTFMPSSQQQGALGKGVQIRLADTSMLAHPKLIAAVVALAEENNINYQLTVRRGGGTNAGAYHTAGVGIPTVVLGVPVRYIHAHYGIAKMVDFNAARQLGVAIIKQFHAGSFKF